jgi:hypothetical protein
MRLADSLDSFRHNGSLLANTRLLLLKGFGGLLLMMAFADLVE